MFKLYVSILSGINKRRIETSTQIALHVARAHYPNSFCQGTPFCRRSRIMLAKEKEKPNINEQNEIINIAN